MEEAGVTPGERVLEIGPGPGGLTRALLAAGAAVWALETDVRMVAHLRSLGLDDLRVLEGDALAVDYVELCRQAGGRFRLVANLPYNISGPLLARLLRQREAFISITVMLQREVAERLVAPPGSRDRGRLSVMVQCFFSARMVMKVAPGSFRPPPKVESRVVRLDPLARTSRDFDEDLLWDVVRTGFGKRRKTLKNALGEFGDEAQRAILGAGLSGGERPETLSVEQWVAVTRALSSATREA